MSKNKSPFGYKTLVLNRLKKKNVTVIVSFADPTTVKGVEDILNEALALGPVCGVYHISTVSIFEIFFVSKFILANAACVCIGSRDGHFTIVGRQRLCNGEKRSVRGGRQFGHVE